MQFRNTLQINHAKPDAYGGTQVMNAYAVKCAVVDMGRRRKKGDAGEALVNYATVMIPARAFLPYLELANKEHTTFEVNGYTYKMAGYEMVGDGSGNAKLYELSLEEKTGDK